MTLDNALGGIYYLFRLCPALTMGSNEAPKRIELAGNFNLESFISVLNASTEEAKCTVEEVFFDHETSTEDSDGTRRITIKPMVLSPLKRLAGDARGSFLIRSPNNSVYLAILESYGGMFFDDGDSQTIYYRADVAKIPQDAISQPRQMKSFKSSLEGRLASLHYNYEEDWEGSGSSDRIASSTASIRVEGEDEFFASILKHLKLRSQKSAAVL